MKKIFPTYLLMVGCLIATGQTFIRGKIIDKLSSEPVEMAFVKLVGSDLNALSNKAGYFSMPVPTKTDLESQSILVSFIGYESKIVSLDTPTGELIIELEKGIVNLEEVVVTPNSPHNSFRTIGKIDLNLQPVRSAQDILRTVPGLFIGQHQGGGKAEQIFLRGFDIDHGTDINVTVDGLPVNMVSHAHGQGYADLHFLIPELTGNVDYGKGPYYSSFGNMGTAGYVSLNTVNTIDKSSLKLELGQYNTVRGLAMIDLVTGPQKEKGTNGYLASEFLYSDGPFDSPQHFNRFNLFGKLNTSIGRKSKLTLIGSVLNSDWDASGQVPDRAVRSGVIDRFGAIDNTEGGYTTRINGSTKLVTYLSNRNVWETQVYYTKYHFNLHSNFTFFLNDPVNGDQIRQRESRNIFGVQSRYFAEREFGQWRVQSSIGSGFRLDQTKNSELSHTINRNEVLGYSQLGDIREANVFAFVDETISSGKWVFNSGIRLDYLHFSYFNKLQASQDPPQAEFIVSPKINIQYTLNPSIQFYAKAGKGFHSNDARVVVFNRGQQVLPAAYGTDLGILWKPAGKLLVNVAAWHLYLQQEFVYVGDEGIVEPSGKTRRTGIDLSGRYQFNKWLFADINMNVARPRSVDNVKGQDYIPLAPIFTSTGGISWQLKNGFSGSLRYRNMKDRPASESKSVIAAGYTITDISFTYSRKKYDIGLAIENIFNVKWNETQFNTVSRMRNEPSAVEEIHFTPGVPFFARIKLTTRIGR